MNVTVMTDYRANASANLKAMKILLVEDSLLLRETIMDMLSECPGLVFAGVASTQNEAIMKLKHEPFDLLLVDIELAQGHGFDVIKSTQEPDYPFPRPTYLILTNHAYPQYRLIAKNLGVEHFFDKSMDFDVAIETIESLAAAF